jgi:hypothetical protein
MLRVAVIVLQILHPLLAWDLMPVSKPRYERVMQDDELRAPCGSMYGLHALLKVRGGEAPPYYSFPEAFASSQSD